MADEYDAFLASKRLVVAPSGFDVTNEAINSMLFPFQRDIVRWALRRGRAAIFADCGMGKGPMQLEWARHVAAQTGKPVLILAPLAVAQQFQREAAKFEIPITLCRTGQDVCDGVNVTNYEMLPHFDPPIFGGVALDESSILKAHDGAMRTHLIESFARTPYRLASTATPAPNDYMELGNHTEFLGVMSRAEMLASFFIHDSGETQQWRLKGHAEGKFWEWVASWAVVIRRPSDLGYDDAGFVLPALHIENHTVDAAVVPEGRLFAVEAQTLLERRQARRDSLTERVQLCADLANDSDEQWLIWCNLNAESEALARAIDGAVEVRGDMSPDDKAAAMIGFVEGRVRVMVSKPTVCGYGMNFQNCHHIAFVGLSDSYEQFYQSVRRCWRFGQQHLVSCHVITAETEGAVVANIQRKEREAARLMAGAVEHMKSLSTQAVRSMERERDTYMTETIHGKDWTLHLGDCVEVTRGLATHSIDYMIFSPPFASLYTYSNSERDMGNVHDYLEFARHFRYLIDELYRTLKPGRLLSFHCMNLPTSKERDGFIGVRDFRGILIRLFERAGFIFHSEVCIWKDPVTAMQRTKAIGLLYKQLKKDSALSRQGIPDYLVTMRKPGHNVEPITKNPNEFPVQRWQRYASPVWMDIRQGRTLNVKEAREEQDERHICPLQLDVIERAIELWSNPGEVVFDPFMGIGSTGVSALELGRKAEGAELKRSYFDVAVKNLRAKEQQGKQATLFDGLLEDMA